MPGVRQARIEHRVLVQAKPDRVYDAFATGPGLDAWFTSGAEVDARQGGHITFRWKEWGPDRITGEDGGPVLEAVRPERLSFQWHPDGPDYATTVDLRFRAVPEGTLVEVSEYGYQDTDSGLMAMLWCAAGWGEALTLLRAYLEHGISWVHGEPGSAG